MCVNGKGAPTIAKVLEEKVILNSAAYKTLKGSTRFAKLQGTNHYKWKAITVRKILTDMGYCDHMENGKYKVENYKTKRRVKVPDSEHIIVKNTHEAIISEEIFETVQTVLSARYYPAHHEHENLFKTSLFSISSRYYSPELGRFIQPADASTLNPSSINGLDLYSYANNNPIGVAYCSSSIGASGGLVSSVALSGISNGGPLGGLSSSGGSDFLGNLISGASSLHGGIDKISSYLAGSVDGLLTYMNNPKYKGFHNKLNSYSDWLMGIGIGSDIVSSAYNNYMNPNLTAGQKWASFGLDVGYIAVTSYLSYKAGDLLVKGAVALGALVGGVPGCIIIVVGIVAGTVLIAVISDALDNWWEEKEEEWFN